MDTKKRRWLFAGIALMLVMLIGVAVLITALKSNGNTGITGKTVFEGAKGNADYYDMFLCSCCGDPISTNCCDMAKERMDYVDTLAAQGLGEEEIIYNMVKKYGADVLADKSMEQKARNYIKSSAPKNPPKISLETDRINLGTVSQKDGIKTAFVSITNSGQSDLVIDSIETSCMCTSASIIYNGAEGPKFGMSMHGENPTDYKIFIPQGESASLKIAYDPNAHGPQETPEESITREITIMSNDPENFRKSIRVDIVQTP